MTFMTKIHKPDETIHYSCMYIYIHIYIHINLIYCNTVSLRYRSSIACCLSTTPPDETEASDGRLSLLADSPGFWVLVKEFSLSYKGSFKGCIRVPLRV